MSTLSGQLQNILVRDVFSLSGINTPHSSVKVKTGILEPSAHGFETQICQGLAIISSWASYLTFLHPESLLYEMRNLASDSCVRIKLKNHIKCLVVT